MDLTDNAILQALETLTRQGAASASAKDINRETGISVPTLQRRLARLAEENKITITGQARATRYALASLPDKVAEPLELIATEPPPLGLIDWSKAASQAMQRLQVPLAARASVSYQRVFVDNYHPNTSSLLPKSLAKELLIQGRLQGQLPAGTYMRRVLEQLLVELSWSSSRLEGNTYSLLDTRKLFEKGADGTDADAVMLLNHKATIEFLVEEGPSTGLSENVVRNIHALLMRDLMPDNTLGAIRSLPVYISDTAYLPLQIPQVLEEVLRDIVSKARLISNPVEAAFFLWVNIAYLQPFIDGNKRTSRLTANFPLMLYNCAPLAFMDVDVQDYARAMLSIYEFNDVSIAVDLFDWTYRKSIERYRTIVQAMGLPDQLAARYREAITTAIGAIVRDGKTLAETLAELKLDAGQEKELKPLLDERLNGLEPYNCARYRLTERATSDWIQRGRPR
jgi:Fic family protein